MSIFEAMLCVLACVLGGLFLAFIGVFTHRGMLTMFKKMAFEWIGGIVLGLILCSGPILDFVMHR